MIDLKMIEGPGGIPIYFQAMPDMVNAVSLSWLIFTGAADDESVGMPGLYHWFEHVPFRGTVKYPGGYADTKGRFPRHGGHNGAYTSMQATCYSAFLHKHRWREGLDLITDLFAQPLLSDEGISSERLIIHNEILGQQSKAQVATSNELNSLLYSPHPFGHTVLGSESYLNSMNADTLRRAHKAGYDRSRASLVVVGGISENELIAEVEKLLPIIPDNGLSGRRQPADFGKRPWPKTSVILKETEFKSSMVYVLFPFDAGSPERNTIAGNILSGLYSFGGGSSPLYRIVREERNLAYMTYMKYWYGTGGAHIGFAAECKAENIGAVLDAFRAVFKDPVVRSRDRVSTIKTGLKARNELRPVDPDQFADEAISRMLCSGRLVNDADIYQTLEDLDLMLVDDYLALLDPEKACTIVFKGTD